MLRLDWTDTRAAGAAAVWALAVVALIDARGECDASGPLQHWPLCWRYTDAVSASSPGWYTALSRVLLALLCWVSGRVLVWKIQSDRPRYFLCPTTPRRRSRPAPCYLRDASVIPPSDAPLPLPLPTSGAVSLDETRRLAEQLPPGHLVVRDFRSPARVREASQPMATGRRLRVVSWNIERGLELPAILRELDALAPDVLLLQEVRHVAYRAAGDVAGCMGLGWGERTRRLA